MPLGSSEAEHALRARAAAESAQQLIDGARDALRHRKLDCPDFLRRLSLGQRRLGALAAETVAAAGHVERVRKISGELRDLGAHFVKRCVRR